MEAHSTEQIEQHTNNNQNQTSFIREPSFEANVNSQSEPILSDSILQRFINEISNLRSL